MTSAGLVTHGTYGPTVPHRTTFSTRAGYTWCVLMGNPSTAVLQLDWRFTKMNAIHQEKRTKEPASVQL